MQNNDNTLYEQSPTLAIYFQKLKGIYSTKSDALILQDSIQQKQYIDYLIKNGLQINNLRLAQFKTKNGLPYTGLIATKNIEKQSILVCVPKQLMLTTKKAFFSPIQEIFQKYPQFFSQYHYGGWQDRILLTFLLYQTQFREKSEWYHLIANLPRDIDYLIFWSEEELEKLNDYSLVQNAKKNLAEFQLTYETLVLILDQYPQYFLKDTYCYDNVKWIYIHLVSRTFGSKLASDAFVPFCEMFNHENTSVYYTGDTVDAKSDDSEESNEEIDEFIYSDQNKSEFIQLNAEPIKIDFQIESMELQIKKQKILKQFQSFKLKHRNNQLLTKYIDTIYKILQSIQIQIHEGKIDLIQGLNLVDELIQENQFTYNSVFTNKICNRQNEQYLGQVTNEHLKFNAQEIIEAKVYEDFQYFNSHETWEEDTFDNFIIKCSHQDEFAKNSQVFFSYGKLSNRNLLLRYGFALEYNIYDNVYVRISENSTTKNSAFSFKIGYNRICEDLLLYFKLTNCKSIENLKGLIFKGNQIEKYKEEIQQTIQLLQQFRINNFNQSLSNLEKNLNDKQLGYHGHFALIFQIERLRIIDSQIEAFQLLQAKALGNDCPQTQYPWTSRLVDRLIQGQ